MGNIFNSIELTSLNVFIEIILGLLLYLFISKFNLIITEEITCINENLFQLLFILGFAYPFLRPIEFTIKSGVIVITCITANIIGNYINHLEVKKYYMKKAERKIFKRVKMKDGYFESKKWGDKNNASNSRFGLTMIGRKSNRKLSDFFSGSDGWSWSQRKALLLHESGHTIFAIPMIILESLAFYYFFVNILRFNIFSILLIPSLLAIITLISWLDELLSDSISGLFGYTLTKPLWSKVSPKYYLLGSLGYGSHPPMLLRYIAFSSYLTIPLIYFLLMA